MGRTTKAVPAQRRLKYIRERLGRSEELSIRELSQSLRVSEMTIRRDLDTLYQRGELIRTHGGAASARRLTFEFTFRSRQEEHQDRKRAIAEAAVRHIEDGMVVILDTGTTTLEIARELANRRKVKVITTSLAIVSELQFAAQTQTILLGGCLREGSPDLFGPLTESNLAEFHADVAFLGADAVGTDGAIYTDDLNVVNLDRRMASVSDRVIVVTNSSKFSSQAMCKILSPREYHLLITDAHLGKKAATKLTKAGVSLEQVEVA
jgi:DeoR/GlpR family transcriptional regulator of sugar metabolism